MKDDISDLQFYLSKVFLRGVYAPNHHFHDRLKNALSTIHNVLTNGFSEQ